MTIKEEYTALVARYPDASQEEKEQIIKRTTELIEENEDEVAEAMEDGLKKHILIQNTILVRQALAPIRELLVMKVIAREYFHRSNSWMTQRLNGNIHNGKPATFSDAEVKIFKSALEDISQMIHDAAERL